MHIHRLRTVDAFVVFDLDDCAYSAGGTRFAPDVDEAETALLARAMTYKFAVLGRRVGGAKGAVRGDPARRDELLRRYCDEVRPLVAEGRLGTGPDLGTFEADFTPLRDPARAKHVMSTTVAGVPFEDLLTGFGVVVAAEAATGSLDGARFAIEGFGKVGGGVAREVVRRGGRVVALSTIEGAVLDDAGLDVELALQLRRVHGDACVHHLGRAAGPVDALFDAEADVLVPGARTGVIDRARAGRIATRWIVPAANAPYAEGAPEILHARGLRALADFVCNAAAVIGYTSPAHAGPGEVFSETEKVIRRLVEGASVDPRGPYEGGCRIAEAFLAGWRGPDGMPAGRPLA